MSKKKKITGALISTGLALSILGGGSAAIALSGNNKTITASATEIIQPQSDDSKASAKSKTSFGIKQLSDEQIAAHEAYAELSKEIRQKYNEQYAELARSYQAEIEKVYASMLGESYTTLQEEYESLGQYQGLVNGFYSSAEYIELKEELDELIFKLATLDKKSAEYREVMDKINTVWGKISVLAGEINSQITLTHTCAAEISSKMKTLMQQNKDALYEQLAPITEKFNTNIKAIQSSLMLELEIVKRALGI